MWEQGKEFVRWFMDTIGSFWAAHPEALIVFAVMAAGAIVLAMVSDF